MSKPDSKNEGQIKTGTSRRSRSGRAGTRSNTPRIMIVAMIVVVAGGAALFWPRGGSVPTGIGQQRTVVSTPENSTTPADPVHSGDVDINSEGVADLTPEKEEDLKKGAPSSAPAETKVEEKTVVEEKTTPPPVTKPATSKPATAKPKTSRPPAQLISPSPNGRYAVQVGAYGGAPNADKEAARLKALGWDARVRAGDNSAGKMVYRVWIGYFPNRETAQKFIAQNSKHIPGAIPVHR